MKYATALQNRKINIKATHKMHFCFIDKKQSRAISNWRYFTDVLVWEFLSAAKLYPALTNLWPIVKMIKDNNIQIRYFNMKESRDILRY